MIRIGNNPLDTTPAYVVTTRAYNVAGRDFGTTAVTVSAGQLAQHTLMGEPYDRAAGRVAAGRHESLVGYDRAAEGVPLIVTVVEVREAAQVADAPMSTDAMAEWLRLRGVPESELAANLTQCAGKTEAEMDELYDAMHGA